MQTQSQKTRHYLKFILSLLGVIIFFVSCKEQASKVVQKPIEKTTSAPELVKNSEPEWVKNMVMYEVNVRNYSEEGTFAEFEKHLPRLKKMGVNVLWFMPVQTIGEKNIKGSLGSPYAIKNFEEINSRMGTMEDFKTLVKKAHEMDMHVLIEWVANHTAWDNVLTESHPDWFLTNEKGDFIPPKPDWEDVIELDYNNKDLQVYMQNEIIRWVKETDIDGYRFDVAGLMPQTFWEDLRPKLDAIKPLFLFTDGTEVKLTEKALHLIYDYEFIEVMSEIAQGKQNASQIETYLNTEKGEYPENANHLYFTSGHVPNSFQGSVFERLGESAETFAVLTSTLHGIPLLYSGQEAGMDKRLAFFEKDLIPWKEHEFESLYRELHTLKKENSALWNGAHGGKVERIQSSNDDAIFAFVRKKNDNKVLVVLNLSDKKQEIKLTGNSAGSYTELFSKEKMVMTHETQLNLDAWGYLVLIK